MPLAALHQKLDEFPQLLPHFLKAEQIVGSQELVRLHFPDERELGLHLWDGCFLLQQGGGVFQLPLCPRQSGQTFQLTEHQTVHKIIEPLGRFILVVQRDKRCDFPHQGALVCFAQSCEGFRFLVVFHGLLVQAHRDQFRVQSAHLSPTSFGKDIAPALVFFIRVCTILQCGGNAHLLAENALGQTLGVRALVAVGFLTEKFKVAAVVEDQKTPFARIFAVDGIHAGKGRVEPRTTADHLPEFRFAAHLFEKDKVDALRHIDARVHHIHRDRNEWRLVRLFEIVNDGLRISIVTDHPLDEAGILLFQLRIQLAKTLPNELRMALVLGKDDGLADAVTARRLDAPFHQVLQHRVHGIGVEDELIQLFGWDKGGQGVVLGKIVLVAGLILR